MTALTDYLLAIVGLWLGLLLWRYRVRGQRAQLLWVAAFLATAVAAAAGGAFHGSVGGLAAEGLLWKVAVFSVGVAACFMLAAAGFGACHPKLRTVLVVVAVAQLAVYGWWMSVHDGFRFVVIDYASAMAAVLLLCFAAWVRKDDRAGGWTVSGILVSFLGAGVEAVGWPQYARFNHDALYHLIQILALWLFYRGATLARDCASPGAVGDRPRVLE